MAFFELSQRIAKFAPLLIASNPSAPEPENKSKTFASGNQFKRALKRASFTLSNVGLVISFPSSV